MKTEKEIKLRRVEVMQSLGKIKWTDEKIKQQQEEISKLIPKNPEEGHALKVLYIANDELLEKTKFSSYVLSCHFETLNWILDQSSGEMLSSLISVCEASAKIQKGAKLQVSFGDLKKSISEFREAIDKTMEDASELLEIDWDELESQG